jgi:hypothetical protein
MPGRGPFGSSPMTCSASLELVIFAREVVPASLLWWLFMSQAILDSK